MKPLEHYHRTKKLNSELDNSDLNKHEAAYLKAVTAFQQAIENDKLSELSRTLDQSFGSNFNINL